MDQDVFNGDADGICALVQLHHSDPRDSLLLTGVKRDIKLLSKVTADEGDRLRVLDISLDKNRTDLMRVLNAGAEVLYVDHHYAGEIPQHAALQALINTSPEVCTSLLVNARLKGAFARWAVVGAYGDNLGHSALQLGRSTGLEDSQLEQLKSLGNCINYNSYGARPEDLHILPEELFRLLSVHADPATFLQEEAHIYERLERGYTADMQLAEELSAHPGSIDGAVIYLLPYKAWARRVGAVFANSLSNRNPQAAHAIVMPVEEGEGGWLVSVRAPKQRLEGADSLCRAFPTGGGRAGAAGINCLPYEMLAEFLSAFRRQYGAVEAG